jgi:four helix bundle protein
MQKASNYKDLLVWQKTRALIKRIYELTSSFPVEERYGLTSQIRRAAISISANLAEGFGRNASREFSHFSSIAYGSATELESLIIVSVDLGFLSEEAATIVQVDLEEILRMLNALRQTLRNAA